VNYLDEIQKKIFANKVAKGFNTTNVHQEFCYLYGEVGEAYMAWLKKKPDLAEELADIGIFLLGLSEILGVSLNDEIEKKMVKNQNRHYDIIDGVPIRNDKKGE